MTMLNQRVAKLEATAAKESRTPRVFRVICSQGNEDAARDLAKAQGWDEQSNDICIIRRIISTSGQAVSLSP